MIDSFARSRHSPLEKSIVMLWGDVERWCGDSTRQDDASVVAVEMRVP
jgi:hypothetical protein